MKVHILMRGFLMVVLTGIALTLLIWISLIGYMFSDYIDEVKCLEYIEQIDFTSKHAPAY